MIYVYRFSLITRTNRGIANHKFYTVNVVEVKERKELERAQLGKENSKERRKEFDPEEVVDGGKVEQSCWFL